MIYDALIIGGGISGCSSAQALASEGYKILLVEKSSKLGGKVAEMGCKAVDFCLNCGVCLAAGLWKNVAGNDHITILFETDILDCTSVNGKFNITIRSPHGMKTYSARKIIVAAGYSYAGKTRSTNVEISGGNYITGDELEKLVKDRDPAIFSETPEKIAFIQCYGSRDNTQKASYCSRVCCAYAGRSARLIRKIHPDTSIDMFYMDMQNVGRGCSEKDLIQSGISIIRSRPEKISGKNGKTTVQYESDGLKQNEYDQIILSCGIAPSEDSEKLAEFFGLGFDPYGFLREVRNGDVTGVYIAGCVGGPRRIEEARSEAIQVAARIAVILSEEADV